MAPEPSTTAADVVVDFLRTCERRDLDGAVGFLADGATFEFPGAPPYDDLRTCLAAQGRNYRSVRKAISAIDVAARDGDEVVVYVSGTLHGEGNDGSSIDGVRFLDRFLLRGSRIAQQEVWNDLALARGAQPTEGDDP